MMRLFFFFCHGEEFSLWQSFLLLILLVATFSVKVANLFKALFTHGWSIHSNIHLQV